MTPQRMIELEQYHVGVELGAAMVVTHGFAIAVRDVAAQANAARECERASGTRAATESLP